MSIVLGADHDAYKQFVPSYEIPLQSREIVVVNEDAPRGSGSTDFSTTMSFMLQNGDPTKLIRSAVVRVPLKAKFFDQNGHALPTRLLTQIGLRNRPTQCLRDVRCMINGVQFTRLADLDGIEQFTRRAWDEGPYQLENTGLPIARPRIYEQRLAQQDVHSTDWLDFSSASDPVVQHLSKGVQSTENRNFEERVKMFRSGYDVDTDAWTGDIVMPLCVGPFQPYESARSGSYCNKYIPFVEQLQVEMAFNTDNRGDPPVLRPHMYSIAQMLFEKNSKTAKYYT